MPSTAAVCLRSGALITLLLTTAAAARASSPSLSLCRTGLPSYLPVGPFLVIISLFAAAIAAAHGIFTIVAACRGASGPGDNVYVAQGLAALSMFAALVAFGYATKQIDHLISAGTKEKIDALAAFVIIHFTIEVLLLISSLCKPGSN